MSRRTVFGAPRVPPTLALLFLFTNGANAGTARELAPPAPTRAKPPRQAVPLDPGPAAIPQASSPADPRSSPSERSPKNAQASDTSPEGIPAPEESGTANAGVTTEPPPPTGPVPENHGPGTVSDEPKIFEPPLPLPASELDAAEPGEREHRAPKTSLWIGPRIGWLIPTGALWHDGTAVDRFCCVYEQRAWSDLTAAGPMFELNIGARFSRHYSVFALWEYSSLGPSDKLGNEFGGQNRSDNHLLGAGLRFSSHPDEVGVVLEVGLGWRHLTASWGGGTELVASGDFFNTRIGLGMAFRINEHLSLSPMVTISGGVFTNIDWRFVDGSSDNAAGPLGKSAQHTLFSLQLGAHFDLLQSSE